MQPQPLGNFPLTHHLLAKTFEVIHGREKSYDFYKEHIASWNIEAFENDEYSLFITLLSDKILSQDKERHFINTNHFYLMVEHKADNMLALDLINHDLKEVICELEGNPFLMDVRDYYNDLELRPLRKHRPKEEVQDGNC